MARWKIPLAESLRSLLAVHLERYGFNEELSVSIQCRNPGGQSEREEVIGRLKGLIAATYHASIPGRISPEEQDAANERLRQEVIVFFVSLLGRAPHGEELADIIGE